jgi:hypothetical protein
MNQVVQEVAHLGAQNDEPEELRHYLQRLAGELEQMVFQIDALSAGARAPSTRAWGAEEEGL